MKGMELARLYYEHCGRKQLQARFPDLFPRMAIGLAGEGSECFGFDDALSRDHDWGPAFCIWLDEWDYNRFGREVQAVYDSLSGELGGYPVRTVSLYGGGRVGVLCTQAWYYRYTRTQEGPQTIAEWRRIPETFLATATNGAVFKDELGSFTAIRRRLQAFYPEDVRIKKIVARAAIMAQAGQYNYPRCLRREDPVSAQLALAEFVKASLSMVYLLNCKYTPYYKWSYRGLREMEILPRAYERFEQLSQAESGAETINQIEGICMNVAAELRRQRLTDRTESFLQAYCNDMMERIQDPELRQAHILEE